MQPLLDGPRAGLTEAQVKALLQSDAAIQITYGADALDQTFAKVADIGGWISDGSVTCTVASAIQRTVNISIDSDVSSTGWSYLSGYVKPYQIFTDVASGISARFNLGVYTLTTPTQPLADDPALLQFSGYDLIYLLKQPVADSYEIPQGSDPAEAAAAVIGQAIPGVVVQVTPSGSSLATMVTYPLDPTIGTTYLSIVQDMLKAIGYREVWVDWEGQFHVEPWTDLQLKDAEWTFDVTTPDNIVADGRTRDIDTFDIPNWFRFVMSGISESPIEGETMFTWVDTSPENPASFPNRGRYVRHVESVTSTSSYADLVSYGMSAVEALLKPAELFTVPTQPFPLAWHLDVIEYRDPRLLQNLPQDAAGTRKVVSSGWTLPLDGQSDMVWTWATVTDQTTLLGTVAQTQD